ncbi:MAG: TRAP transporter large permease subunit [Betaproteobacteria bacterium]|nr:TRAP transporter large permease subunit [Betaproteobacteria bacterium]
MPLVVWRDGAQVSVWDLFLGGFLPGILMGFAMMVVVAWRARARNYPVHSRASFAAVAREFRSSFLALMAPVVILGGLYAGIFTPTEAGVVASLLALMLGFVYKKIRLGTCREAGRGDAHDRADHVHCRRGGLFGGWSRTRRFRRSSRMG